MNTAAQRSMFDMLVIHDAYIKQFNETVSIPRLVRRFLNTVTYGVGVYRTVLGRPGEWSGMRFKQIAKALEDPLCWYTIIIHHKPEKSCSIGRYLPKDFKWMLRMLMDFSGSPLNLLFEPTGVGKRCQMHRLAKQHALVYTPGYESAEPTLMRKFCETAAADPNNALKAQRMEAKVDAPKEVQRTSLLTAAMSGHNVNTQTQYYDLNSRDPMIHAASSRAYIEEFIGPVLIIPSHNDFDPKRTADIILEEFKTLTSTGNRLEGDANCNDEGDEDDMQEHCEDEDAAALEYEEGQLQASDGEQQSSGNVRGYKFDASRGKFEHLELQNPNMLTHPKHHDAYKQTQLKCKPENVELRNSTLPTWKPPPYKQLQLEDMSWVKRGRQGDDDSVEP